MTVTNSSCASQLYNVCIEPFHQGLCNLQTAFSCKKVTLVATDILKSSAPVTKPISFARRVASLALGTLLFIPMINSIVMAILQCVNSGYLYPPVKQLSSDPVSGRTGLEDASKVSEASDSDDDVDAGDVSDSEADVGPSSRPVNLAPPLRGDSDLGLESGNERENAEEMERIFQADLARAIEESLAQPGNSVPSSSSLPSERIKDLRSKSSAPSQGVPDLLQFGIKADACPASLAKIPDADSSISVRDLRGFIDEWIRLYRLKEVDDDGRERDIGDFLEKVDAYLDGGIRATTNIMRHLIVYLRKIQDTPEYKSSLNGIMKEFVGVMYHCSNRESVVFENIYFNVIAPSSSAVEAETLEGQFMIQLAGLRKSFLDRAIGQIPNLEQDIHRAATYNYYNRMLGPALGVPMPLASRDHAHETYAVKDQESGIMERYLQEYTPRAIIEMLLAAVNPVGKGSKFSNLFAEWIRGKYANDYTNAYVDVESGDYRIKEEAVVLFLKENDILM